MFSPKLDDVNWVPWCVQNRCATAIPVGYGHADGVVAGTDPGQVALNCLVRHCFCAKIRQHPQRVSLAGRLHDPRDHQIPKHRIVNDIEAQPVIDRAEDVVEQPRTGRRGARARRRRGSLRPGWDGDQFTSPPVGDGIDALGPGSHLDIENLLVGGGDPPCTPRSTPLPEAIVQTCIIQALRK
jgi:hypothetical protein